MAKRKRLTPRKARWMFNLFPPFLFQRIRAQRVAADFRSMEVVVRRSLFNRNLNGTLFGGTIFSAVDPVYAVLFWQIFAHRDLAVEAWLKSASIEYLAPAKGDLWMRFEVSEAEVEAAERDLQDTGKATRSFRTECVDKQGTLCARAETEVYLRLRRW